MSATYPLNEVPHPARTTGRVQLAGAGAARLAKCKFFPIWKGVNTDILAASAPPAQARRPDWPRIDRQAKKN
jgi:hypothetical protein